MSLILTAHSEARHVRLQSVGCLLLEMGVLQRPAYMAPQQLASGH